jgi:carbonic anhydrase
MFLKHFGRILLLSMGTLWGAATVAADWSYHDEMSWGLEYKACKPGGYQSPINIEPSAVKVENPARLTAHFDGQPSDIVNNGYTIQVDFLNNGLDGFEVANQAYQLQKFYFHSPSENTVDHQHYPMEMHFVTQNNKTKQYAVVAVFFEVGDANAALEVLWAHMPKRDGQKNSLRDVRVDLTALLPASLGYYQFPGSLTTPPCTGDVVWYVLKTPITLSRQQLEAFTTLYYNNNRQLQSLNGRTITTSQSAVSE